MSDIAMFSPDAVTWHANCSCGVPPRPQSKITNTDEQPGGYVFTLSYHPCVCPICETPYVMVVNRKKVAIITDVGD